MNPSLKIMEEPLSQLAAYGTISMAYEVKSRFRCEPLQGGAFGIRLVEEPVDSPYIKDYEAFDEERPTRWKDRWDIKNWGVISAFENEKRVGGAVLAWRTEGLSMLDGRDDLAVLWDMRIHPDHRGQGVGHNIFNKVKAWARERSCVEIKIETQNINVPGCKFYARQGCVLKAIDPYAYSDLPHEIRLIWHLML